jgi:hypothetical protein
VSHHPDTLHAEVSWIAYHLRWDRDDILDLDHVRRRGFVAAIQRINALDRD